jgi:hypothetical protein
LDKLFQLVNAATMAVLTKPGLLVPMHLFLHQGENEE